MAPKICKEVFCSFFHYGEAREDINSVGIFPCRSLARRALFSARAPSTFSYLHCQDAKGTSAERLGPGKHYSSGPQGMKEAGRGIVYS